MKKIISIILIICLLFSFGTVLAADKVNPDLDWVYEAVSESINGKQYIIPAININSESAKKMNKEFIDNYNNLKDSPRIMGLTYDTYQYEDFLIIITITSLSNGNQYFKPYIINTNTGDRVSGYDIISVSGLSEDNFVEMLDEIISDKLYGKLGEEAYDAFFSTTEEKDNFVNDTIDNINLQDDIYIGEDGNIIISTYIQPEDGTMRIFCPINTDISLRNNYENKSLISVFVNGDKLEFDQPPIIIDSRTMVPIRAIFEELGYTVSWNQSEETAYAIKGNDSITVRLGDNIITSIQNGNSSSYECDVAPQIIGDRILVPLRAIAESSNCKVDWDETTYTVTITSDSNDDYTILKEFAEGIDSITYNETGKTMYDLKYIIADVTGDGKDNLVIVGVDNGYMGPYRLFEVVSGNVSEISYDGIANNFYLHNGGQYALVNYQGFIRLFNFGTGSKSGYAINLLTYENGAWQFNELSRTNFAGESNKESYTVEGNIVSAEEYNSFNDSIYSNILTADDLSNLK